MAGRSFEDGSIVRFLYDGVAVIVPLEAVPDWARLCNAEQPIHFAATWEDGLVHLYVNGLQVASGGEAGRGEVVLRLGDLQFGEDYPDTSLTNEPFLGLADDLLVLRRALDADEIVRLVAEGPDFLVAAQEAGILYTLEQDDDIALTDRLTADGAADTSAIDAVGAVQDGVCQLLLNHATSAAGSIRVELLDEQGAPIPRFTLEDCDPIYGDAIEHPVSWRKQTELAHLAGQPVSLRIELKDADLYAIRFGRPEREAP